MTTPCPSCHRFFEAPVTLTEGVRLTGHRPGGPGCIPVEPIAASKPRWQTRPPDWRTEMAPEERAELVRRRLAERRVSDRMADSFGADR